MQVFELSGFRRHDEPDEKSYKYQCVFINVCLSIFSPGTFSRVSTSSANHELERRVLSVELLRSRMAPEQGTLTEIIDLNKESPSRGHRPYHWVGGPRILRPDTYIYIYTYIYICMMYAYIHVYIYIYILITLYIYIY